MELEEKYKTGVFWQDVQHEQLIDLSNKITKSNSEGFDTSMFLYTVGFLVMYVNQHFKLEEEYMDRFNYPDTITHKNLHKEFIKKLKDFRVKYKAYSQEAADILSTNVLKWIKEHILENDKKLGYFLIKKEKEDLLKK